MLRRQRTILKLLSTTDGGVSATQLQKYIFLLRKETVLCHDSTFYEFLPYRFGPYSFAAQREIETLTAYGYIQSAGSSHSITALGRIEAYRVDADTARAVLTVVSTYGKKPLHNLLKDVYTRYPWFATKSELVDLIPNGIAMPKTAPPAVYTIGYENCSVDGFLNRLIRAGIQRIIDVRSNPVSRKYGFARSTLAGLGAKMGLCYSHFPELGISSDKRKAATTKPDFTELFSFYEQRVLPSRTTEIANVAELMKLTPSVLLCMEKEAADCHRSRLATRIACLTSLGLVHL
jgi:uncharacterized protein YwgA